MKKQIVSRIVCLVVWVFTPQIVPGQGTMTYLSNLGQPSTGSVAVGSDSWLAAYIGTGNNASGYLLNSVQLGMTDASGSPGGFSVMLYSSISGGYTYPGVNLGTLTGSLNPVAAGDYTYTAPANLILSPDTQYFVVMTSGTTVANGAYEWSLSSSDDYNAIGGWGVPSADEGTIYEQSSDGFSSSESSSWNTEFGNLQFALNATPAPEPGALSLFAAGGLGLSLLCRKMTRRGLICSR